MMKEEEFRLIMCNNLKQLNLRFNNRQISQLYQYMVFLLEENEVMNLTRIIEPREIIIKHFIDSLTIVKYINEQEKVIDIGSGAGFPGIPVKIAMPKIDMVLLDSLNKRIKFLQETIKKLGLEQIRTIHGRAEDYGQDINHREKYDVAVSRAVAPLNVLIEYMMPFIKIGGFCLCMKSSKVVDEVKTSEKAIKLLGGEIIETEKFLLPSTNINRKIIILKKNKHTIRKYPRKAGIPSNAPI